jgi:hypothetical protein
MFVCIVEVHLILLLTMMQYLTFIYVVSQLMMLIKITRKWTQDIRYFHLNGLSSPLFYIKNSYLSTAVAAAHRDDDASLHPPPFSQ